MPLYTYLSCIPTKVNIKMHVGGTMKTISMFQCNNANTLTTTTLKEDKALQ